MYSTDILVTFAAGALVLCSGASAQPAGVNAQRPFTAKIKTTYLDQYGGETSFLTTFCRRPNGSYALFGETEGPGGAMGTFSLMLDAANRTFTSVRSVTHSVVVLPLTERDVKDYSDMNGTCDSLSDGTWIPKGEATRLGYRVLDVEEKSGNDTIRLLVVPELNCFPLLRLLLENGEVRTKEEVLSLELGDPDPAAFTPPAAYDVLSPMQFEERYRKKFGTPYYSDAQVRRLESQHQDAKAKGRLR